MKGPWIWSLILAVILGSFAFGEAQEPPPSRDAASVSELAAKATADSGPRQPSGPEKIWARVRSWLEGRVERLRKWWASVRERWARSRAEFRQAVDEARAARQEVRTWHPVEVGARGAAIREGALGTDPALRGRAERETTITREEPNIALNSRVILLGSKSSGLETPLTVQRESLRMILEYGLFGETQFLKGRYGEIDNLAELESLKWLWGTAGEVLWQFVVDRSFNARNVFSSFDSRRLRVEDLEFITNETAFAIQAFLSGVAGPDRGEWFAPIEGEPALLQVYSLEENRQIRSLRESGQPTWLYRRPAQFVQVFLDPRRRRLMIAFKGIEAFETLKVSEMIAAVRTMSGQADWEPHIRVGGPRPFQVWADWDAESRDSAATQGGRAPTHSPDAYGFHLTTEARVATMDVESASRETLLALLHFLAETAEGRPVTDLRVEQGRRRFAERSPFFNRCEFMINTVAGRIRQPAG